MFLGLPDDIHEEKLLSLDFENKRLRTDGRMDGRTGGRTDRPSHRDTRTHLKTTNEYLLKGDLYVLKKIFSLEPSV